MFGLGIHFYSSTRIRFASPILSFGLLSVAGTQYIVLGGQHLWYAIAELRRQFLAEARPLPEWLVYVKATILHHHTPVAARQRLAGDSQFVQSRVSRLGMGDFARLCAMPDAIQEKDIVSRVTTLVAKCGWERDRRAVCFPLSSCVWLGLCHHAVLSVGPKN